MGTIVQKYGPIYGEAVNGTVQGRPNGSYYIPPTNTIEIIPKYLYITKADGAYRITDENGSYVQDGLHLIANAQDLSLAVGCQVFSDAECTTVLGYSSSATAGQFNTHLTNISFGGPDLVDEQTYYLRGYLITANYTAVAYSEVIAVTAVV